MIVIQLLSVLSVCVIAASRGLPMCTLRLSLAKAEQLDDQGFRCWDTLPVPACGGRCESREISDWKFPFKKSYHPVCVHGNRRAITARLRHCDKGVAEGTDVFRFIAAEDCRCKICSSEYTSCEWLPPNSTLLEKLDRLQDYE